MEIAPGISAEKWINLDLDDPKSDDWIEAIWIYKERISKRYILPAQYLVELDQPKRAADRQFGFSIMAICCLLVETLQSFVEGVPSTRGRSQELVVRFLSTHREFAPPFDENLAMHFYRDIRCGILHLGESQRDALVWSVGNLVTPYKNSIRVNRTMFYRKLEEFVERYTEDLTDPKNTELRVKFRRKMDFVARKPGL